MLCPMYGCYSLLLTVHHYTCLQYSTKPARSKIDNMPLIQ